MNAKQILAACSVVGIVGVALVGCGDSSGTGGAGGTATTSVTGTGTTTSSSKSTSVTGTGTGTGTGSTGSGASCQATCQAAHPQGNMILTAAVISQCGCQMTAAMSPCKTECTGNPACADPPMAPTGACSTCLQTESAKGAASACSLAGATGTSCQGNVDCKALVTCILGC